MVLQTNYKGCDWDLKQSPPYNWKCCREENKKIINSELYIIFSPSVQVPGTKQGLLYVQDSF